MTQNSSSKNTSSTKASKQNFTSTKITSASLLNYNPHAFISMMSSFSRFVTFSKNVKE